MVASMDNKENVVKTDGCPLLQRFRLLSWSSPQKFGSSHKVAYALDLTDNNSEAFVKLGMDGNEKKKLRQEVKILRKLRNRLQYNKFLSKSKGALPYITAYDVSASQCHYLVTRKAGTSLEIYHENPGTSFSINDLSKLGVALIQLVEYAHETGYIHRDIHPGNVVFSGDLKSDEYEVVLIDFGQSRSYMKNGEHMPQIAEVNHDNSYKSYCSANHECQNLSRKNDLEMVGITLVELKESVLPYREGKVKAANRKNKRRYLRKARLIKPLKETCERLNLPDEFHEFIDYCRSLAFADQPDYAFWKQRFQKLLDVAAT